MSNTSDTLLSEGTCYFGAGQLADKHFIPCGNANTNGPQSCCYEGDFCLSSNACWNMATVVTYIAGCTDPLFRASTCPQRNNYPDQQWVALARCDGADIDLWTGCAHHPEKIQIEKENCNCNMSNVLIQNPNGKDSFDETGQLPNATGEAIDFSPTYVPTVIPTSSPGGGLSTGAKAGIGVGVAIAGLLIIASAVLFFLRRRRSKPQHDSEKPEVDGVRHNRDRLSELADSEKSELTGDGKVELAGDHDRGASVDKSDGEITELDGNDYNGVVHRSTDLSELGTNTPHPGVSPISK